MCVWEVGVCVWGGVDGVIYLTGELWRWIQASVAANASVAAQLVAGTLLVVSAKRRARPAQLEVVAPPGRTHARCLCVTTTQRASFLTVQPQTPVNMARKPPTKETKSAQKRQRVFLYRRKANVDKPATTYVSKMSLVLTCCKLTPLW